MTSGSVIQGDKLVCVKVAELEEYSLASVPKDLKCNQRISYFRSKNKQTKPHDCISAPRSW